MKDLDVSELDTDTFNTLMALQTLLGNPEGFWDDYNIFEDVVLGLNGVTPNFGGPDFVSPGQLAFGVYVAQDLVGGEPSPEVRAYTAIRLHGDPRDPTNSAPGLIWALPPLDYCQEELDELVNRAGGPPAPDYKKKIQERFRELGDKSLDDVELSPSSWLDLQVAQLLAIRDYIELQEA
jgi:hypothetical protein